MFDITSLCKNKNRQVMSVPVANFELNGGNASDQRKRIGTGIRVKCRRQLKAFRMPDPTVFHDRCFYGILLRRINEDKNYK
jgi:hypothetical protein